MTQPLPSLQALAVAAAQRHGIPSTLFKAQIGAESGWNPGAVSPAGAVGLGQLMPATARGLGVANPRDPVQNLEAAATYLEQQYKRFGRWDLALAAYNAGPNAVAKAGNQVPQIAETQNYVAKIMGAQIPQGQQAPAPMPPVETGTPPPQPGLGMNLQQLLNFAAPSPRAVGILGRLGGTAAKVAQASQAEIPLPKPVAVAQIQGPKGEPVAIQTDISQQPVTPLANTVVKQAEQYLGTPYLWGGADPRKGFDCSGFVQYLYARQGIALPRTTYQQVKVGQAVHDPAKLQPGDIIFFSSKGDVHHEGLYIGDGQFIHAPRTGDVVKISSLSEPYYAQQFFVGRRVKGG